MQPKNVDYKTSWDFWGDEFKRVGASSRHTRRIIRSYMQGIPFRSIIDIGCGTGLFLESLDLKGKQAAGIDISDAGIAACKKKLKGDFQVMDIAKRIPAKRYDIGICSEVLEHVKDDRKAMKNLHRLCRHVVISVPSGRFGEDDKVQGHYRRYSKEELRKKLREAGFEVVKMEAWGFPFYSPLYRFLVNRSKEEERVGKMTLWKWFVSTTFYLLFFLNLKRGDRLFALVRSV